MESNRIDSRGQPMLVRPDGSSLLYLGWAAGTLAGVFLGFHVLLAGIEPALLYIVRAFAIMAVLLLVLGYIIRALYFIGGQPTKPRSATLIAEAGEESDEL